MCERVAASGGTRSHILMMPHFFLCFMTGSTTGEHMHQDVEFIYVMDGSIRVTTLEKAFVLGSEDAMIINSNHRHSWLELESAHVCVIHFDYAMLMDYNGGPDEARMAP